MLFGTLLPALLVQWTAEVVEGADDTEGRGGIERDWVDFADELVHREIPRRQLANERG
jgi:hypothetical protein